MKQAYNIKLIRGSLDVKLVSATDINPKLATFSLYKDVNLYIVTVSSPSKIVSIHLNGKIIALDNYGSVSFNVNMLSDTGQPRDHTVLIGFDDN